MNTKIRASVALLLSVSLAAPLQAQSLGRPVPREAAGPIQDHSLQQDGTLAGVVVDTTGRPVPSLPVILHAQDGQRAETTTDAAGEFRFPISRGGLFAVEAADTVQLSRLWTPAAAPPAARSGQLQMVVPAGESVVVRGQLGRLSQAPWNGPLRNGFIALGVLTAVVVAVAVDDAS